MDEVLKGAIYLDLQRDMRNIYDVVHKITPKEERMTYRYFLKRKKFIKEIYDENRYLLLHNEESLLDRRNHLHTMLNSPTSPKAIGMSIECGVMASFFYGIIYGMDKLPIEKLSTIFRILAVLGAIIAFALLAVIFSLRIFKHFKSDKCLDDLHSFELSLIEDILNENYQSEKSDIKRKDERYSMVMEESYCKLFNQCQEGFWERELGKILILIFCVVCILSIISNMMNNWKILEFSSEILGIAFFGYYAIRYALSICWGWKEDKKRKGDA